MKRRLWWVLFRCDAYRFVASVPDVAKIADALKLSGDYVRDVIFPAHLPTTQRRSGHHSRRRLTDTVYQPHAS